MFGLITLAISLAASWFGYSTARRFVRERLRYVDAAQSPGAALGVDDPHAEEATLVAPSPPPSVVAPSRRR